MQNKKNKNKRSGKNFWHPGRPGWPESLDENVDMKDFSQNYREALKIVARQFNQYITKKDKNINFQTIREFVEDLKNNYAAGSYRVKLNNLKTMFLLQKNIKETAQFKAVLTQFLGELEEKPMMLRNLKYRFIKTEILSQKTIQLMIDKTEKVKHKLVISFLYHSGCRVDEMLEIARDDIEIKGYYAKINFKRQPNKPKGYRAEIFVKSSLIDKIINNFGGKKFLFEHDKQKYSRMYVYKVVAEAGARIGLDIAPIHLRNAFAKNLVENGKNVIYVSKALGDMPRTVAFKYFNGKPDKEIADLFDVKI